MARFGGGGPWSRGNVNPEGKKYIYRFELVGRAQPYAMTANSLGNRLVENRWLVGSYDFLHWRLDSGRENKHYVRPQQANAMSV